MNRKMLTIILAVALIAGFFLPLGKGSSASAFDAVQVSASGGVEIIIMTYGWLLIPVSGLALLIGALNKEQYAPGRMFWALLPLLFLLYMIIRPVTEGAKIGDFFKGVGIGFWVMLGASLILAVYHGKK